MGEANRRWAALHPEVMNAPSNPLDVLRQPQFPEGRSRRLSIIERNEAKNFCLEIVRDPLYRANLKERAQLGRLHPTEHQMLWHYAYGKPVERVEVTSGVPAEFEELTTAELADRAETIAAVLREIAADDAKQVPEKTEAA